MPRLVLSISLAVSVFPSLAGAVTRNVPADYPTIQAALGASVSGDVVLVSPGTYVEHIVWGPSQDGVTLRSAAGAALTIIDGDRQPGSVIRINGVGPMSRLEGFTITGGGPDPPVGTIGGGIRLSGASPVIQDNIIKGNHAEAAGGLYVDASSPSIVRNEISDNHAPFGSGGGIYCDNFANPVIEGNVITGNTCAAFGGGVTIWVGSAPQLLSNSIVSNSAMLDGGGVYVTRNSHPVASRNIVAWSGQGSGVVVADGESTLPMNCNDVFGNLPGNFSGIADPTGNNGNFSANPLFCSLSLPDLHLSNFSPCAPGNSPEGCGLVGALDIGCAVTPALSSTWGRLKTRYR